MLDQAWSRPRPTARDRGQPPRSVQRRRPQTPSVYRRNHGYSIADDIEASMREEEDDAMASPSAGNSTPFIPFTFSPPSRRLFTHPGARPRVTKTYATQARGAQSSPPYKATSSTNPQRSGLSHSSPSYVCRKDGFLDAKMHPGLSNLSSAQPAEVEVEDDVDKGVEAERQGEERFKPSPLPPSSPLTSIPSSPCPSSPPASSSPIAVGRVSAEQDRWCSLLVDVYNFTITDSQAWGGGEAWINLVTMVMEFLDPLMESGQHPVRVYFTYICSSTDLQFVDLRRNRTISSIQWCALKRC